MTSASNTPARPSRTSRRHAPEEARGIIMAHAINYLRDNNFRDMTVAALMEGTPLSRPAFYRYFDDVHHLVLALLEEIERIMHETANPWILGIGEPREALRVSLAGVVQTMVDHGPVVRAVVEAAPMDEKLEAAWGLFLGRWDEAIAFRIAAQQAEGLVPAFEARDMGVALVRLNAGVLIPAFGSFPQDDPKAVLATLVRIWESALYARD